VKAAEALDILTLCRKECFKDLYATGDELVKKLRGKYKPGSPECGVLLGGCCLSAAAAPAIVPAPAAAPAVTPEPLPAPAPAKKMKMETIAPPQAPGLVPAPLPQTTTEQQ